MSDRSLFIISLCVIVACLGACGWMTVSGAIFSVDGLFLALMLGLLALAFALYVWFLIGRNIEEIEAERNPKPVKKTAPAAAE